MKKLLCIIMALLMLSGVFMTSCADDKNDGGDQSQSGEGSGDQPTPETPAPEAPNVPETPQPEKPATDGLVFRASSSKYGDYYYVDDYTGSSTDVYIPSTYNGKPVKSIESEAFYNCKHIVSVTLGDGIESIGSSAFENCTSLSSIILGSGIRTIESDAFYNTAYYNTPSNWKDEVLYIGNSLFKAKTTVSGHRGIKNGTVCIASGAFDECAGLSGVTFPNSLKSIGSIAFYGCISLTAVSIPNSVEIIEENVFYGCTQLSSVTVGNGLRSIGYGVFKKTAYYNNQSNWENNALYINNHLFAINGNIVGSYSIKQGTRCIAQDAFARQKGMTAVTIPNSVISICNEAFYSCTELTEVVIPDSVKYIEPEAFEDCFKLYSVTVGQGVTEIGYSAFDECFALVEVINRSQLDITAGSEKYGCIGLSALEVHTGESKVDKRSDGFVFYTVGSGHYLIGYAGSDTEVVLPGDYNGNDYRISNSAFIFSDIIEVVIPENLKSIGDCAFYYCENLENIKFRGSETKWNSIPKGEDWDYGMPDEYTVNFNYTGD